MQTPTLSLAFLTFLTLSTSTSTSTWTSPSSYETPYPAPTANSCAAASILASGIALNILDQRNEQSALSTYSSLLASYSPSPIPTPLFESARSDLLTFVVNGIAIRQTNQLIAPSGNPATSGLAIVANAQLTELGLSKNLTGTPRVDENIVKSLASDFAGGIVQNMENQAAATSGCPASAPTSK